MGFFGTLILSLTPVGTSPSPSCRPIMRLKTRARSWPRLRLPMLAFMMVMVALTPLALLDLGFSLISTVIFSSISFSLSLIVQFCFFSFLKIQFVYFFWAEFCFDFFLLFLLEILVYSHSSYVLLVFFEDEGIEIKFLALNLT